MLASLRDASLRRALSVALRASGPPPATAAAAAPAWPASRAWPQPLQRWPAAPRRPPPTPPPPPPRLEHLQSLLLHPSQRRQPDAAAPAGASPAAAAALASRPPLLSRLLPDAPPSPLNGGWTRREVVNAPNALCLLRAACGPATAALVLAGRPGPALALLLVAASTDAVDGYLARRLGLVTPLGSYLDPLADKVLFLSAAAAAAHAGLLPAWLVALLAARDGGLVGGAALLRLRAHGWAWPGGREFFRLVGDGGGGGGGRPRDGDGAPGPAAAAAAAGGGGAGAAPPVVPLLIGKAHTGLTCALLCASLGGAACGVPGEGAIAWGEALVAASAVASGAAYARAAAAAVAAESAAAAAAAAATAATAAASAGRAGVAAAALR